ncbi:hypothetical protein BaRGS_00031136 [Batillaria attramentaria]|uniref:RING-type domain-containing protein n=1 Tax=Batillaria attramentaria TaxID=370345 RepID=A0ABD0JSV3_9CAEN
MFTRTVTTLLIFTTVGLLLVTSKHVAVITCTKGSSKNETHNESDNVTIPLSIFRATYDPLRSPAYVSRGNTAENAAKLLHWNLSAIRHSCENHTNMCLPRIQKRASVRCLKCDVSYDVKCHLHHSSHSISVTAKCFYANGNSFSELRRSSSEPFCIHPTDYLSWCHIRCTKSSQVIETLFSTWNPNDSVWHLHFLGREVKSLHRFTTDEGLATFQEFLAKTRNAFETGEADNTNCSVREGSKVHRPWLHISEIPQSLLSLLALVLFLLFLGAVKYGKSLKATQVLYERTERQTDLHSVVDLLFGLNRTNTNYCCLLKTSPYLPHFENSTRTVTSRDISKNVLSFDIINTMLTPRSLYHGFANQSNRTGHLAKLAGQTVWHVRPVTRFLPDTTNNPGLDLAHLGYRLATLSALPPSVPVSRVKLADAGFYYRGQGDEMICYSCRARYSGWTGEDIPMDVHRRISPQCPHVAELDRQLSALSLNSEAVKSAGEPQAPSEPRQITGGAAVSMSSGASRNAGEPQAFSAARTFTGGDVQHLVNGLDKGGGGSISEDGTDSGFRVASGAHAAVSREGSNVQPQQTTTPRQAPGQQAVASAPSSRSRSSVPVSESQQTPGTDSMSQEPPPPSSTPVTATASPALTVGGEGGDTRSGGGGAGVAPGPPEGGVRQMFPRAGLELGGAVYPMYQDMASRRRSFPHWDDRRAPPLDQLILCGMFYAGYADCVRCFYCGVGLKHWEVTDDVWTEHVRWRPSCGYLRAVKGDDYIRRTLTQLGREAGNDDEGSAPEDRAAGGGPGAAVRGSNRAFPPERANQPRPSPGAGRRGITTDSVASIVSLPPASDRSAAQQPQTTSTEVLTSSSRTMTSSQATASASTPPPPSGAVVASAAPPPASGGYSSQAVGARPERVEGSRAVAHDEETQSQRVARLQAENRELARRLRCKVCHREPIDTILMPCGHLVVCETCARGVTQCPLCHDRIRATAKVHMN